LRSKALTALATSGDQDIGALFRHMLKSETAGERQLGCVGLGMIKDDKATQDLAEGLYDPNLNVRRAACLALVSVGTSDALEAVAEVLLHGDEDLRRAAAEAFANHQEEGHPILRDGATLDDLLVRRAVVFGLVRVRDEWAIKLLEQMQLEDGQWVVRNAATQALDDLNAFSARIPKPVTPLHETPWLIAFAGDRGLGLTSGQSAVEILLRALREGNPDEQIAALDELWFHLGDVSFPVEIYHMLYGSDTELQEAAYRLIWHFNLSGVELPPPAQYGLG
jgi:HEAT repeat protein